jgi:hypothetical protein
MKSLSNKQKLYLYVALLFVLTFTLTSNLITGFKTNEFNYINIILKVILVIFSIMQIIQLAKIENDENKPK